MQISVAQHDLQRRRYSGANPKAKIIHNGFRAKRQWMRAKPVPRIGTCNLSLTLS